MCSKQSFEYVEDDMAVSLASLDEEAKLLFVEGCTRDKDNDSPNSSSPVLSSFLTTHLRLL